LPVKKLKSKEEIKLYAPFIEAISGNILSAASEAVFFLYTHLSVV
jgi:hypothetical protein